MPTVSAVGTASGGSTVTAQGTVRPASTVTPERAAFVQDEYRSVVWQSTPVRDAYGKVARDTKDEPIATFFDNREDAYLIAQERGKILGSHARRFRVVVDQILTEDDLGFATALPGAHLIDPELAADMDVAVAAIEQVDFNSGQTTLIVWGRVGNTPVSDDRPRRSTAGAGGSSSATAVGAAIVSASGTASGSGSAQAATGGIAAAAGTASGAGVAEATAGGIIPAVGTAVGAATAVAVGSTTAELDHYTAGNVVDFESGVFPSLMTNDGWTIEPFSDAGAGLTKALVSRTIGSSGQTDVIFEVEGATNIAIRYKVSSEDFNDYFRVLVGETIQQQDSGNSGVVETMNIILNGSRQTIRLRYMKDSGFNAYDDNVKITRLTFT